MSDSLRSHGLVPASLLCPWASPGENTGVGCYSLLQGIFLTQGSNPGLLQCSHILYCLSYREAHFNQGKKIFQSFLVRDAVKWTLSTRQDSEACWLGEVADEGKVWNSWCPDRASWAQAGVFSWPEISLGMDVPAPWDGSVPGCLPACLLSGP